MDTRLGSDRAASILVAVGAALLGVALLLADLGPAPTTPAIPGQSWIVPWTLVAADEFLLVGPLVLAAGLVPFVAALGRRSVAFGFAVASGVIALCAAVVGVLALGRLAYPIDGIPAPTGEVAGLVFATFVGSVHLLLLMLAVIVGVLGWQWWPRLVTRTATLALSALLVASSFPWIVPVWLVAIADAAFIAWGVAVALRPPQASLGE